MFSLVVFDLDGTLIDSIGDLVVAVNRLVAEYGGRALDGDEVKQMVGEGADLLLSRAFEAAGVRADSHRALPRFLEIYDAILPGETRPYPGIPEMLGEAAPHAAAAVLTNKPASATRKILALLALDPFFVEVIGGDGPFRRKPYPDGLRHLIGHHGTDPASTLMVGDSTVDLRTAQAAGARTCVARYGFGYSAFAARELRGDEFFADHPRDIVAVLSGARGPGAPRGD